MNGYMYYLKKKRTDPTFQKLPLMEQSSQAAKEFRVLPENEKKVCLFFFFIYNIFMCVG